MGPTVVDYPFRYFLAQPRYPATAKLYPSVANVPIVRQKSLRYGAASNTRRSICEPTTTSAKPALRSVAIWTSTTAADRIRALTASHPIKPTSTRCASAWQPNHGRGSTYRRGKSVQTTGTTSDLILDEMVLALRKQRIPASRSALSRFFAGHGITIKKKPLRNPLQPCNLQL
jgi:hypothetical protein